MTTSTTRRILLLCHPRSPEARTQATDVAGRLRAAGVEAVVLAADPGADQLLAAGARPAPPDDPAAGCELALVLGGDGTILRAAELCRGSGVPILGVNLGHVGFLAQVEQEGLDGTVDRVVARDYAVESRTALEVTASHAGEVLFQSWALNEVTVEKASRERMVELTVVIDGHPLSTWGCDGVVMATPTGSTAYAFSAGGPVVWPAVEALLLVPLSAHALFARPVVVGPTSTFDVDVLGRDGNAVVWCDGRRAADLPAGSHVHVRRSDEPVRLALLDSRPFTDRLVDKFDLPIDGWRGSRRDGS